MALLRFVSLFFYLDFDPVASLLFDLGFILDPGVFDVEKLWFFYGFLFVMSVLEFGRHRE